MPSGRSRLQCDQTAALDPASLAIRKKEDDRLDEMLVWREGLAVCDPPVESNTGMVNVCRGPLQTSSGALDTPAGDQAINWACGIKEGARPLGAIAGKRIFGCGYGIHPEDPDGKYPGNQDIAAKLGMADVPGRATFHCSRRTSAFCRSS